MVDIDTWNRFVEEGEELYNYMIDNFNNMIDGESIKHFDIVYGPYHTIKYIFDIKEKYFNDIHKEIIPWIKKEFDSKSLFKYNNWIPFRDQDAMVDMFLGYRKLFQYKEYFFQLTMLSQCDKLKCNDCNIEELTLYKHFGLALYGWKEGNTIQPDNLFTLNEDNIMPDKYWYWERKYCTGR